MFKYYGLAGLTLIVLIFLLNLFNLLPYNAYTVSFNHLILITGVWLLFDALDFKLNKYSILHRIRNKHSILLYLVLGGIFIGLFIEFFGAYASGLWWEPFYTYLFKKSFFHAVLIFFSTDILYYVLIFPACFSVYRVIYHFFKKEIQKSTFGFKKYEKNVFPFLGLIGLGMIIPSLFLIFISKTTSLTKGVFFGISLLGLWFFLEYLEYKHHQKSMLKDLFELNFKPALAILITSFLLTLATEGLNLHSTGWKYRNFPLADINLLGIPLMVFLGWVPFVIVYLSFFRVFFREKILIF